MMLEYTRTKEELERLLLVEDRERIDRDLHDSVIQRLYATGLELQALAARYVQREPDLALRLIDAADGWDDTITQIRATIFALQPPDIEEGAPVGDRATSPGMRRRRLHPHTCGSDDEAGAVWWCRHQLGKKLSAVERGERVVFEVERLRIAEEKCRDSS
jgi:hypothetical protein